MAHLSKGEFSIDDILHPAKISSRQWVILLLGLLVAILDGYDIIIVAFTAPAISEDWNVSAGEMGVVFSASLLGMTFGAMFLAWLADRYGRCIVISAALGLAGLATLLAAYSNDVNQFVALRFVAGLALGVLVATLPTLMGEFSPRLHRTAILGVIMAGNSIGGFLGGIISAELIADHGWTSLYFYAGAASIALGVIFYMLVPESLSFLISRNPAGALARVNQTLRSLDQSPVDKLPEIQEGVALEKASVTALLTPSRRYITLLCWTTFFTGFLAVYFVTSWLPQLLVNAGFEQVEAIKSSSFMPLGSIFGTMVVGFMARWISLNKVISITFILGSLVMYLLNVLLGDVEAISSSLISAIMFLLGFTLMAAFTNLYTIVLTVYPAQIRSTGLGWSAGLGRSGAVLSPILAGVMISWGLSTQAMFLYFSIPVLLAAMCSRLIRMSELP